MQPSMFQRFSEQGAGSGPIQCTESRVDAAFPLHWHDYCEMEFVQAGHGTAWLNNQAVPLAPGSLYLLMPGDLHRVAADAPLLLYSVKFMPDALPPDAAGLLARANGAVHTLLPDADRGAVAHTLASIHRELACQDAPGRAAATAHLTLLLVRLARTATQAGISAAITPSLAKLRQAIGYIREHSREPITLADVAQACGLSACHLSSRFAAVAGCGFSRYLAQCRLHTARALLRQTDLSVTEIAYLSGFGSLSHFFRTFHASFRTTPEAYRLDRAP